MEFLKGIGKKWMKKEEKEMIYSPIKGQTVPLLQVKDPAFSSLALGEGVGILPTIGEVYAPVDGKITAVFPTNHGIGVTSKQGAEILIHVGMDTVELKGQYFTCHVKEGQEVKKGEKLISFELDKIREAGYELTTPVVITNTGDYHLVIVTDKKEIEVLEELLILEK